MVRRPPPPLTVVPASDPTQVRYGEALRQASYNNHLIESLNKMVKFITDAVRDYYDINETAEFVDEESGFYISFQDIVRAAVIEVMDNNKKVFLLIDKTTESFSVIIDDTRDPEGSVQFKIARMQLLLSIDSLLHDYLNPPHEDDDDDRPMRRRPRPRSRR